MGSIGQAVSKFWFGKPQDDYEYEEYDDANYDSYQDGYTPEVPSSQRAAVAEVTPLRAARNEADERHRIVTIRPTSFDDATRIASVVRDGDPVIMNLAEASPDLARRMLDFVAGVVYVLDGGIETITSRVYLLSPGTYTVDDVRATNDSRFRTR